MRISATTAVHPEHRSDTVLGVWGSVFQGEEQRYCRMERLASFGSEYHSAAGKCLPWSELGRETATETSDLSNPHLRENRSDLEAIHILLLSAFHYLNCI